MESTFKISTEYGYIDLNLFNQFEIYVSFKFIALMALVIFGLRARKVLRDRRRKQAQAPAFTIPADPAWN